MCSRNDRQPDSHIQSATDDTGGPALKLDVARGVTIRLYVPAVTRMADDIVPLLAENATAANGITVWRESIVFLAAFASPYDRSLSSTAHPEGVTIRSLNTTLVFVRHRSDGFEDAVSAAFNDFEHAHTGRCTRADMRIA
jgi:hypothetical protein